MLTVREALQMDAFAQARVVAGEAGLDREIRWVHIVDMPDSQFKWVKGGELLLTTGLGLKAQPATQATLVPELASKGMSGLVLSTGYYLDQAPSAMREAGNRLNFPVIEVPPEVMFIDLTEAIFTRIINEQYDLQSRAFAIHRRLTSLVLEGGDIGQVVAALGTALQRSVAIESTAFQVLATFEHGPTDHMWANSDVSQASPDMIERFLQLGIYDQLASERAPIRVPPMPELGMDMERVVAPIVVDREIYGAVWIIAGDRPFTQLDTLAIDHAATVAALLMLRDKAVREAEQKARGDLFEQLLAGEAAEGPAHQLGLRLERNHTVLVVSSGAPPAELAAQVEHWLHGRSLAALVLARDDVAVAVVETRSESYGRSLAQSLADALDAPAAAERPKRGAAEASAERIAARNGDRLVVGMGQGYPAQAGLRRSFEEALEANRIGGLLGRQGVVEFAELGFMHWLYHLPGERRTENRYVRVVAELREYDEQHHGDLLRTLEVYLDSGNALAEASAALNVHRNTLLYRLRRIEELTGLDLRSPIDRLNLHVAVKGYRLENHQG
jgi:PucR family transcriptional regulator, purine catabolism regulatory protein